MRAASLAVFFALGCASARGPSAADPSLLPPAPETRVAQPVVQPAAAPVSAVLTRLVLQRAIERGMGHFLGTIEVAPALEQGRFVGFRLVRARHLPEWRAAGLDIREGDVVTAINGHSIERPETAMEAFAACRETPILRVDVLRSGTVTPLTVPVRDP